MVFLQRLNMAATVKPKPPLTPDEKKARAKELCKKLLFAPHAQHCVPSRCSCYLADIKELLEILK